MSTRQKTTTWISTYHLQNAILNQLQSTQEILYHYKEANIYIDYYKKQKQGICSLKGNLYFIILYIIPQQHKYKLKQDKYLTVGL